MSDLPSARSERVEKAIERWHNAPPGKLDLPLSAYLGWTWVEYARYVEQGVLPPERKGAK